MTQSVTLWIKHGGYSVQKTLYRDVPPTVVANKPLGMWMTPYKMQNLVYEWLNFSKFSQIWAKIGSNSKKKKKKKKNRVILLKIGKLVYEWVTFSSKIGRPLCKGLLSNSVMAHPYQNQTWVTPQDKTTPSFYYLSSNDPLQMYNKHCYCHQKTLTDRILSLKDLEICIYKFG